MLKRTNSRPGSTRRGSRWKPTSPSSRRTRAARRNVKVSRLEKSLSELEDTVKDGFDDISEAVSKKLNDWLK